MRDATAAVRAGLRAPVDPFAPVRPALDLVGSFIDHELSQRGIAFEEMGRHLLVGGKRLRPALVLLCGGLFGAELTPMVPVAAACEIIHMATLVHDDLIDGSETRRGVPAVHVKWGTASSVLLGDHLFATGFSILADHGDPAIVRLMSDVVSRTCAGEIDEMRAQWDLGGSEEAYLERIYAKTGHFIAQCCRAGALLAGAPAPAVESVTRYGAEVGTCFQLVDDLLDFTADERALGKPTGSDLRAGVYTLPVVWALAGPGGDELRALLVRRPVDDGLVAAVASVLQASGALEHATRRALAAARRAQAALSQLPPGVHREHLHNLAEELAHRVS